MCGSQSNARGCARNNGPAASQSLSQKNIPSLRLQRRDNRLVRSVDGKKLVRRLNCSPQTLEGGWGGCWETRTCEMFCCPTDNDVINPACGAIWVQMRQNRGIALIICHLTSPKHEDGFHLVFYFKSNAPKQAL
jgi:hypothetical protein